MPRYVALLRGINVGGRRSLRMEALRAMAADAGGRDVATYIQSGNLVLTHAARSGTKLAAELERAIVQAAGFAVTVIVRTAAEWQRVVGDNPFADADTDHLHVSFRAVEPAAGPLTKLDPARFLPERWQLRGREIYLFTPNGLGRSPLAAALSPTKPLVAATVRNWRTVQQLQRMVTAGP
ncbi:MAG: DUF1697 domain-containing protein [Myxococcota bacterium]|nr:DUF1697 domain-containing protein [Myxococcota bacterium]